MKGQLDVGLHSPRALRRARRLGRLLQPELEGLLLIYLQMQQREIIEAIYDCNV
jgi:hypothetical protein